MNQKDAEEIALEYAENSRLPVHKLLSVVAFWPVSCNTGVESQPKKWQATFIRNDELTEISSKPYIFLDIDDSTGIVTVVPD